MSVKDLDVLSGSLKRALDDVPVHVRQLAHMFRKHGTQHKRNRGEIRDWDVAQVPPELRDGWKKEGKLPIHVVQTGKGDRPDPATYLDQDYIDQHLDHFADGGVRFYRRSNLDEYGPGNRGTTFVFPRSEFDRLRVETGDDPRELGKALGLGENFFVDSDGNPVDVWIGDFSHEDIMNGDLRIPSGNEGGANDQWIPGGYLPNGMPEAVFRLPEDATKDNPAAWPGSYSPFAPGDA